MDTPFERLVRFVDDVGETHYGEAAAVTDAEDLIGTNIPTYGGGLPWESSFKATGTTKLVYKILSPLASTPVIQCTGLNYRRHIEETKKSKPQFPAIFTKPTEALTGPFDDVTIHRDAQWPDYEGELCFVLGRPCKDIGADEDPLSYILGYTIGNDLTSRYWQAPERSSWQASYAKSFDHFCPLGPFLCSARAVRDPGGPPGLRLTTRVNGEVRQDATTSDLLFAVPDLVRFASRGHTIPAGAVFMTGTPGGVGAGFQPPVWLRDGDVVEVAIEGLGGIRNRMIVLERS